MDTSAPISPSSPNALAVIPTSASAYAKMKKMISSPRGKRRAIATPALKTFGVPLDEILSRDASDNSVPYVVHKLCQYVLKHGLLIEGIFRVNANMKTVDKLKGSFDKNGDADLEEINDVMAVAGLIKMFLRELPDSVIPDNMQPAFIKAQSLREDKEQYMLILRYLIQKMPESNFDLLNYLIDFLRKIAENSDSNKMTSVALAVVFGPNIFKCSESLQGLQEQACVNAITCKLIEKFEYLFAVEDKTTDVSPRASVDGSPTAEYSPRKKPVRPPPPKFTQQMSSPRKNCADENSNVLGDAVGSSLTRSMTLTDASSKRKSRIFITGPHERKEMKRSVTITVPELGRSLSPPKSFRAHATPPSMASPSSKQIVDNTVHDAVREHLFGTGLVTSSSESDTQGYQPVNSPEQGPAGEEIQRPIRDALKKFTASKLLEANNHMYDGRTENKFKLKRMIRYSSPDAAETADDKSLSPRSNEVSLKLDLATFDEMEEQWQGPLASLTSNRAGPPRNRKPIRSERKTKSENIDELLKNRENERNTKDDTRKLSLSADNPLLVKIKNDRTSRAIDASTSNKQITDQNTTQKSQQLTDPFQQDTITGSPNAVVSPRKDNSKKLVRRKSYDNDGRDRPVVPPLDLVRVQTDFQDIDPRFSPKEKFANVLTDSPIRSPRSFPSDGAAQDGLGVHRQQMFHEKKQDSVPILDMSAKDLKKRIESLRKIITNFETAFEAEHQRTPKPTEKIHVQKYIAELGRAKKQLKELMSTMKENADRVDVAQTTAEVGFAPNLRDIKLRDGKPTKEDTLNLLLKKQSEKRFSAGRPEEIEAMSSEQLKDEKLAVQKALLQYENLHGRPTTKEDKTLMRPIYDRYRRIKRLITTVKDIPSSPKRTTGNTTETSKLPDANDKPTKDLHPIIEGELHDSFATTNTAKENNNTDNGINRDDELNDTFNITRKPPDFAEKMISQDVKKMISTQSTNEMAMNESVLHDATAEELLQQQKIAKKSKKVLGKKLKDYEDTFFAETGRKVQKEDRSPFETDYGEYKLIKARLRLLEALITKKKANQTV